MTDFSKMSMAAMVAFYNAHSDKPIKRFADRASAERRCRALEDEESSKVFKLESRSRAATKPADDEAARAATKPADDSAAHARRSEGVARSWENPTTRALRSKRMAVEADGMQFPSVAKAFEALGLPAAKRIAFRGKVRREGEAEIEGHRFRRI